MLKQSYKLFKISAAENKKPVVRNLSISVALEIFSVALLYFLNGIYGTLYSAIQTYDTAGIWSSITNFTLLAMLLVVINGYLGYYLSCAPRSIRTLGCGY